VDVCNKEKKETIYRTQGETHTYMQYASKVHVKERDKKYKSGHEDRRVNKLNSAILNVDDNILIIKNKQCIHKDKLIMGSKLKLS
jgi:muramoyltetrapeptide carboxypeptidase LdcA involved in peptidoglycan recycling